MFVIWKDWVANVLAKKIVGFDSSYEFQFPIDSVQSDLRAPRQKRSLTYVTRRLARGLNRLSANDDS